MKRTQRRTEPQSPDDEQSRNFHTERRQRPGGRVADDRAAYFVQNGDRANDDAEGDFGLGDLGDPEL